MKSIRRRITTRILLGATVLQLIAGLTVGIAVRRLDIEEFDSALETKARTLATLVMRDGKELEVNFAGEYMPEFQGGAKPEFFHFRLADGTLIERSDTLGDQDLPFEREAVGHPVFRNYRLPDGRAGRFVQISFPPRYAHEQDDSSVDTSAMEDPLAIPDGAGEKGPIVVLTLARSREDLDRLLMSIYASLGCIALLLACTTGWLAHRSVLDGFGPIDALNRQIDALSYSVLDQRVTLPDPPEELHSVLLALNRLLDGLDMAFTREKRFSSDVAHELRTLVAELRASCEVASKWQDDPELVRRRLEGMLGSALNMEKVVYNLLTLARTGSAAFTVTRSAVHIAPLADVCWAAHEEEAQPRKLRFSNRLPASLVLNTDDQKLEIILQNLIGNAVTYSVADTEVLCTSSIEHGTARICVANYTGGLSQDDIACLAERFWRKDTARSGRDHSGLGLSIVASLAEALNIGLQFDLEEDGLFKVCLTFPDNTQS